MAFRSPLNYIVSIIIFFIAGTIAILEEQPAVILIPFAVLLSPAIFNVLLYKTQWILYILLASIPLSTEINFSSSLGLDLPDEFLMILLSSLFITKVIYKPGIIQGKFFTHPLLLLLFLHLTWIVVSVIFSQDKMLSLKFFIAKSWFIIPFVILPFYYLNNKRNLRLLCYLFLIPMSIVVIQALIRHAFFNFTFTSVKEIYSPFFRNHVNFSAMLVCLLAVLFTMYRSAPASVYRKILFTGLAIGFTALVLAYSRGAWVALLAGIAASWSIRKKLIGWSIMAVIISLLSLSMWLLADNRYFDYSPDYNNTVFHQNLDDHLSATLQFKDVSNAERFYRWIAGVNMVAERPITGFGPNNFYSYYQSYTQTPFRTWVSNNPDHSSVHNYFLLTAIEQGLPGVAFFSVLYFGMIWYAQKMYHTLRDVFYKQVAITIGIILSMIGALIFVSDLIETDKIGSLFWLCLGLLIMLKEKREVADKLIN